MLHSTYTALAREMVQIDNAKLATHDEAMYVKS